MKRPDIRRQAARFRVGHGTIFGSLYGMFVRSEKYKEDLQHRRFGLKQI